jgi:hypothetical protein
VAGYAVAYVVSATEQKGLKALMGSNDEGKLYVNGQALVTFDSGRSLDKDQDSAAVDLKKGQNVVVLKVINEKNNWQGCLRFVDAQGAPAKGLSVTLKPE